MRFVDLPVKMFDQHNGVAVLDLKQKPRRTVCMAGDRGGRPSKGPRHPTMVRVPVDHYAHYVRQAEALQIPVGDFIAYRMAVNEGLGIPDEVLVANPGLLALLSEPERHKALAEVPGLAARHRTLIGVDPLFEVERVQEGDRAAA